MFVCSEKHRISRDDVVVGQILGEGFFGEVHDGVYKSPVSSSVFQVSSSNITPRIKIKSIGHLWLQCAENMHVCVFVDWREDLCGHQDV